ncbi:hypothetical protein JCM8115_007136 [Rhodotorula mucilaginosa]
MHDADDDGSDYNDKEWSSLLEGDDVTSSPPPPRQQRARQQNLQSDMTIKWSLCWCAAFILPMTAILGHYGAFTKPSPAPSNPAAAASMASLSADSLRDWQHTIDRCEDLHVLPGPPDDFLTTRQKSDRVTDTTPHVLIKNARVWTGQVDADGKYQTLQNASLRLRYGLITEITEGGAAAPAAEKEEETVVDAQGAWITPGIFDMHSHLGVDAQPSLSGTDDTNSRAGPIQPQLRTIDTINAHDLAYKRTVAGGVTTTLVLPGSANNIGGQAFLIKLRPTQERTIDSLALEVPYNVATPPSPSSNSSSSSRRRPRWRHMKHACGENIRRVYSQTRLDLAWNFRNAYAEATKLKRAQDRFCERALEAHAKGSYLRHESSSSAAEEFPDDLKQEALVDVLRGKVKVNTHCYTVEDLNSFIRLTHEFQFPVAAFHHAHETYLVPDLLKQSWPGNGTATPAVALFSLNGRYKREAWFGSEYAAKVLSAANVPVTFVSDHPVTDSRHLLYQAQQAHHYGLDADLALASIMSTPARIAGMSHRVGVLQPKYDADLVLWTDHPLKLGATPQQVWIDGIPQLVEPFPPAVVPPNEAIDPPPQASLPGDYNPLRQQPTDDGFDFLDYGETEHTPQAELVDRVRFVNVSEIILPRGEGSRHYNQKRGCLKRPLQAIVSLQGGGRLECLAEDCPAEKGLRTVDLKGGALLPPLVTYGSAIGLTDIISEKSTTETSVPDPLSSDSLSSLPHFLSQRTVPAAHDALAFDGKQLRTAERNGVRVAITAPPGKGFLQGFSVAFRTGAENVLEPGAVLRDVTALHIQIGHLGSAASVAAEIAELRKLLSGKQNNAPANNDYVASIEEAFALVAHEALPLVIRADKADVLASLVKLKLAIESKLPQKMRWVIHGGQEAHLVASQLADAEINVILTSPRSFPTTWDARRALPGPPLTADTAVTVLHHAGVRVALGVEEEWQPSSLMWEAAWAHKLSRGQISRSDAVKLVTTNVEDLFNLPQHASSSSEHLPEFVAYEGDPFEFGARVVAAHGNNEIKIFP